MMRKFSLLLFLAAASALFFGGCDSKIDLSPKDVKPDRDVCHRCKMVVSAKNYAAQIVNPENGEHYFFDDLGCAVLWIEEQKPLWGDRALVYIADVESGKWLDAKKAFYTSGAISPMRFGFAAHEKEPLNALKFDVVKEEIFKIKAARMKAKELGQTHEQMHNHTFSAEKMHGKM